MSSLGAASLGRSSFRLVFPFVFSFKLVFISAVIVSFQPPNKRIKTSQFAPEKVVPRTKCLHWVNWKGERPSVAVPLPSPEMVSQLAVQASARDLIFRDPNDFTAGEILITSRAGRKFFKVSLNGTRLCPISSSEWTSVNTSSLSKVISREHIMTRHCPLAPDSRTTNHVQASRISLVTPF